MLGGETKRSRANRERREKAKARQAKGDSSAGLLKALAGLAKQPAARAMRRVLEHSFKRRPRTPSAL